MIRPTGAQTLASMVHHTNLNPGMTLKALGHLKTLTLTGGLVTDQAAGLAGCSRKRAKASLRQAVGTCSISAQDAAGRSTTLPEGVSALGNPPTLLMPLLYLKVGS